jgi:hypothetical protein
VETEEEGMRNMRTIQWLVVAGLLVIGGLAMAPGAGAKAGDVIRTGACSGVSDWRLKLSPDNGQIEVEYQVDSNKAGQTWRVRIRQNGVLIFAGTRVTQPPSGSFTVRRLAKGHAGTDAFRARAVNLASGETCVGRASIG